MYEKKKEKDFMIWVESTFVKLYTPYYSTWEASVYFCDKNDMQYYISSGKTTLNSILGYASECGNIDSVRWAISKGADPHFDQETPIGVAADRGHQSILMYLCLYHNADITVDDFYPIAFSAKSGHLGCLKFLLNTVYKKSEMQFLYALELACKHAGNKQKRDIVEYLFKRYTKFMRFILKGKYQKLLNIVRWLPDIGQLLVDFKICNYNDLLCFGCDSEQSKVIDLALGNGADINTKHGTPIYLAAQAKDISVLFKTIHNGAKIDKDTISVAAETGKVRNFCELVYYSEKYESIRDCLKYFDQSDLEYMTEWSVVSNNVDMTRQFLLAARENWKNTCDILYLSLDRCLEMSECILQNGSTRVFENYSFSVRDIIDCDDPYTLKLFHKYGGDDWDADGRYLVYTARFGKSNCFYYLIDNIVYTEQVLQKALLEAVKSQKTYQVYSLMNKCESVDLPRLFIHVDKDDISTAQNLLHHSDTFSESNARYVYPHKEGLVYDWLFPCDTYEDAIVDNKLDLATFYLTKMPEAEAKRKLKWGTTVAQELGYSVSGVSSEFVGPNLKQVLSEKKLSNCCPEPTFVQPEYEFETESDSDAASYNSSDSSETDSDSGFEIVEIE